MKKNINWGQAKQALKITKIEKYWTAQANTGLFLMKIWANEPEYSQCIIQHHFEDVPEEKIQQQVGLSLADSIFENYL